MRKPFITAVFSFILFVILAGLSSAEIIFAKEGQMIQADITEKSRNTVQQGLEVGDTTEEVGSDISG